VSKYYMVFGYGEFYPCGGMNDLLWEGLAENEDEALAEAKKIDPDFGEYDAFESKFYAEMMEARRLAEEWRESYLTLIGQGEDYRTEIRNDDKLPWEVEK